MRDSLRTALWWLLPVDGDFRRAPNGLHYYLARQGWRVVLRGGNVTSPFHQSHLNWIHDPTPTQSRCVEPKNTVSRNNITEKTSDPIPRNPLAPFSVLPGLIPVFVPPVFPLPVVLCARKYPLCPGIIVKTRCPPLLHTALPQLLSPQFLQRNVGQGEGG